MLCFSSPPANDSPEEFAQNKQKSDNITQQLSRERKDYENTQRLLLLGAGESGKSTILKQMVILHLGSFTKEQRKEKALQIKTNVKDVVLTVTEAMSQIDPPVLFGDTSNIKILDEIKEQVEEPDFDFPPIFFDRCAKVWKDSGVQKCFERSNEYQLIDCAPYFMEENKLRQVSDQEYLPDDQDVLHCRVMTRGILEIRFTWDKAKFHVFDVGGQRGERKKWVQCFNDVTAIIFVVASSSFNMVIQEDKSTNRLHEALELFEAIWTNRWLREVSVILFLNKQDLLKQKIKSGKFSLERYFPEFAAYRPPGSAKSDQDDNADTVRAKYFIRDKFVEISVNTPHEHKYLYPYFTTAVDTENIRRVFIACRDIIQRLHLRQYDLL